MIRFTMTKTVDFPDERVYRAWLKAMSGAGTPNEVVSKLRLYESPQEWEEGAWKTVSTVERVVDLPGNGAGTVEES